VQAIGTVGMPAAALTLVVATEGGTAPGGDAHETGLIRPLAAQSELVLGRVDGEGEAFLGSLAPDAPAPLVQALGAIRTLPTRHRTLLETRHRVWQSSQSRASGFLRPPA
jgi:hypothetical protein